jgi:hypothetical protein
LYVAFNRKVKRLSHRFSAGRIEKCGQRRSLTSPERLRVYALKRFAAQAGRQVDPQSCSDIPPVRFATYMAGGLAERAF